jgi:hypothetical protein
VLVLVSLCDSDETIEACERFSTPADGCSWWFGCSMLYEARETVIASWSGTSNRFECVRTCP